MKRAVIVNAKRTPIGKVNGALRELQPQHLAAPLLKQLANGVEEMLDDIIIGNVVGPGGNIARVSVLEAGLPLPIPGITIDRQCSAGLEAIRMASYFIQGGAGHCYIAGGVESTSTSPFPSRARFAPDQIGDPDMGVAAEYVAEKCRISRNMQDEYARLSYERSWDSFHKGLIKEEIIPFSDVHFDEEFSRKRNIEALLRRARPIFKNENGTVTAANSCGIHDGAAAVLVMEEDTANQLGMKPILRFVDSKVTGVHPHFPGFAPVPAIQALLEGNNLTIEDVDLIEINEAFSSKIVACAMELSIPYEKLNVCGGALSFGHPYAASGAILVTRLFYEVQRRNNINYVLAAIGSGGGIGVAVLFEVIS
ncbi:acetyl-CoA C-acyltransferase [Cytobacillus depressus]|uniref:Acetyl-CoA C-acyltransferase n=1 Tax=Cytobacillus depressus TaxID=1602942 RepID=A0A6L3VAX6_9BACI|nr:acetyl-CoA C-acyltransferase [Cytobacillus depressus]KAB2336258.1 acetyl-CoA C-acyltransferase [Cytobacillus depressus]